MHKNTKWIIDWSDRMYGKYGHPEIGYDWSRKLAYEMGEEGNDHPSEEAIIVAKRWEVKP